MRQSINISEFKHVNPIPNACRIGNLVMSGLIVGMDPQTGKVTGDLKQQCALMFRHVRSIVEAAGCTTDDIIKMSVWLANPDDRTVLNDEWLEMFSDPDSRPARQTLPRAGGGDILIQCDIAAVARG